MRPSRGGVHKKSKTMDYTNYAYNEAVGRLKMMLADSYTAPKTNTTCSYLRSFNDDSADNYSDNMSTIDRPVFADISKYLSPSQKSRLGGGSYRPKKTLSGFSASKENLTSPARQYQTTVLPTAAVSSSGAVDYYASTPKAQMPPTDSVQAPVEIFNFIEKQEDYIEQLEKESKYCRNELSNLLGKVKDVINENEQLTEHARSELNNLGKSEKITTSPSSDSDDILYTNKKTSTPRKKEVKSPRYASAPNIVYEARISELEAELMQANIDLKRVKTENDDLKKKLARSDISTSSNSALNCEAHRKQIELLQKDKTTLEETIRQLHKSLDEAKSQQYSQSSKRYINDLVQMERSQAELEVRHLRDELDRQHERVRELQHEMARRLADERANAERRYNNQVDQLGGDLSSQWEQVAKLQLDLERQKRYENDLKRDLANRNSQIEELKMELRANRSTFLADMAQVNAEKQSLEQEITALRLQLDRASRENKTEAARLNAEINSLRQRLDRADADLLHSKREVLRLNDEIANLEKELAYGEMKNEIRPTKKDLDKRISEMQEKHAETVNELEEMIQSQKQLMDKLTNECKTLTNKLEDTTLKHNAEKQNLRDMNSKLMDRLKHIWSSYKELNIKLQKIQSFESFRESPVQNETNSGREEHNSTHNLTFIQQQQQQKPLSTTSRPHLAQPTTILHDPLQMTTAAARPILTATTPYWEKQQPVIPTQQQPCPPLQQLPMIMTTSPNMNRPIAHTTTKHQQQSMTTMTKISKTTLAKERKSNSISSSRETQMLEIAIQTQMTQQETMRPQEKYQMPQMLQTIPQPITVAMRDTINSNMMPQPMIPPMINHSTEESQHNMMAQDRAMIPQPMTTMPQIMMPLHINTTPVEDNSHRRQSQQHQSRLLLQQQPLYQHQLQTQAQALGLQVQQKAELNRERAVALWGQQLQLEESPAQNPLCHNSLPRQQPKSSCDPELDLTTNLTNDCIDPFDLEFSISSPSLMRSFDSDTCTEIDDNGAFDEPQLSSDSLTDKTLSPAQTAIRRMSP
ncbi:centrosomal protein of 290 kDa isoform X1 [Lucilia cuprina]|uniref:centrosomal protein of 290 kDa isoform X1 n=1 Tax=Lucilia cuprina TaxID=7375 RepID=UPI001F05CFE0|nr:centrosomal protein of 290 kDa isoform X1 [Lucilia cuprina]